MKLKSCPFCGGLPVICHSQTGESAGGVFIECTKCKASSVTMFPEKCDVDALLVERWNERYVESRIVREHREMKERLNEIEEILDDGNGKPLRWRGSGENIA